MNYQTNDMINTIYKFFTRIDLLMFSHTNKRFKTYSQKYLLKNCETFCKLTAVNKITSISTNVILCANAAFEGHLNILIYLRENGCYWDSNTCAFAAYGGYLEVLKFGWLGIMTVIGMKLPVQEQLGMDI